MAIRALQEPYPDTSAGQPGQYGGREISVDEENLITVIQIESLRD